MAMSGCLARAMAFSPCAGKTAMPTLRRTGWRRRKDRPGAGNAACSFVCFRHADHDAARFCFAKQGNIADGHTRSLTPSWRSDRFYFARFMHWRSSRRPAFTLPHRRLNSFKSIRFASPEVSKTPPGPTASSHGRFASQSRRNERWRAGVVQAATASRIPENGRRP